jgi:hypothetical protein
LATGDPGDDAVHCHAPAIIEGVCGDGVRQQPDFITALSRIDALSVSPAERFEIRWPTARTGNALRFTFALRAWLTEPLSGNRTLHAMLGLFRAAAARY